MKSEVNTTEPNGNSLPKHYPSTIQSLGIAGILVLMMLVGGISHVIFLLFLSSGLVFFLSNLISTGLTVWIVCRMRKKKTGQTLSFRLSLFNGRTVLWTVLGTLGLIWGIETPLSNVIPMPDWVAEIFREMVAADFFTFLTVVITAPILEEVLFRGIMLDGLLKQYSPTKSIVLSSVLFGVVHLNPWQFITAFIISSL